MENRHYAIIKRNSKSYPVVFLIAFLVLLASYSHASTVTGKQDVYPLSPNDVVKEYCSLDAAGNRAGFTPHGWDKISEYVLWEDEPGWDGANVFTKYVVKPASIHGKTAKIVVVYWAVGRGSGNEWTSEEKRKKITFVLKRVDGRWKIAEPQTPPHISIDAMIQAVEVQAEQEGLPRTLKILQKLKEIRRRDANRR